MYMLKNFIKYQSLGNDFIIFDWYKRPATFMQAELHGASWQQFVQHLCNRHYGIGADGVLIITTCPKEGLPEMLIFNADGTQAENCLNGARCVAHYLFSTYTFPTKFNIKVGQRISECTIVTTPVPGTPLEIIMRVGKAIIDEPTTIQTAQGSFNGHRANVGNPHFIVFQETTPDWLSQYGNLLESHQAFAKKTNVEFVWHDKTKKNLPSFNVLVYERGCGITLSCSSGAASITSVLAQQKLIAVNQKTTLLMQGGSLTTWIDTEGNISLQAHAHMIFKGSFEEQTEAYKPLQTNNPQ